MHLAGQWCVKTDDQFRSIAPHCQWHTLQIVIPYTLPEYHMPIVWFVRRKRERESERAKHRRNGVAVMDVCIA